MQRSSLIDNRAATTSQTRSTARSLLGLLLQFTGIALLFAGIMAIPCGFVSYVIPYPPFVFSEWSSLVVAIIFFSPLLLIPASILCIDAGKRMRRMCPPGAQSDDS